MSRENSYNWPMQEANRIMAAYPEELAFFNRRLILIWAAKFQSCPKCNAEPYTPCINLTERKKNNEVETKWPHNERIDWGRLVKALRRKGYRIYR